MGTLDLVSVNALVLSPTSHSCQRPFLVRVQLFSEQAQICASLDVPLGSVLSKPCLKRVGSRVRGQGRPGCTFVHALGYDTALLLW